MSLASGEDLSPKFPAGAELMLQNRRLFFELHVESEKNSLLFRTLHPGFAVGLSDLDALQRRALLDGVSTYEIAAGLDALGKAEERTTALEAAVERAHMIVGSSSVTDFIIQGSECLEESTVETPKLIEFGAEVLGRYVGGNGYLLSYGLVGIALARLYHLSNQAEVARILAQAPDASESD